MRITKLLQDVVQRFPKGYLLYYYVIKLVPLKRSKVISELDGNIFLITSTGRTGTTLFAKMLNAAGTCEVVHEPFSSEQHFHRICLENPLFAEKYLQEFRLKEIFLRRNTKKYGEVNSALRRVVKDLKKILPKTPTIHIVRNGYDVVSSILNRKTFTGDDKFYRNLVPHESTISKEDWNGFSRFEKICFMWAEENRWLSENCDVTVKFENLIDDYEYFYQHICLPTKIDVNREVWCQHTKSRVNKNKNYEDINNPTEWTTRQHEIFNRICGNEMKRYGYKEYKI